MIRSCALGATLLLLLGACAGRGERAERGSPEVEAEELVEADPPLARAPLICVTEEDCRLTQLPRPIGSVVDCYCPECPAPLNFQMASEYEEAWERLCAGDWEIARRCLAPMCPPLPGVVACVEGRCGFGVVP